MDNMKHFIYSCASVMTVYTDFLCNSKSQMNWWLSFKLLKNRREGKKFIFITVSNSF